MKMLLSIFVLSLCVSVSALCLAAPGQPTVSGTMSTGETLTISVSSPGTKSTAAPQVWDNFEGGVHGGTLTNASPTLGANWGTIGSIGVYPSYTNTSQRTNSTLSSYHNFSSNNYNCSIYHSDTQTGNGDVKYFTFWWRYDRAGSAWSPNTKPWQEYGTATDEPMMYIGAGSPALGDGSFRANIIDESSGLVTEPYGCSNISTIESSWVRWEGYFIQSTPSTANGTYQMWLHDGSAIGGPCISKTSQITRTTANGLEQWAFGEYSTDEDGYARVDDIYIDDTPARIEIGDNATWANCTHREIQIPSSWSDGAPGSITVTANLGAFAAESTVYLYVIDSANDASPASSALTVGAAGAPAVTPTLSGGVSSGCTF